jgi:uncharacterized membrane protein YdjX (TVP38/TMEM64 family)
MPLLPEVVACMAGLARMPWFRFLAALACGSAPMAATYAFLGHAGAKRPALAVAVSALLPFLLWAAVNPILKARGGREVDRESDSEPGT